MRWMLLNDVASTLSTEIETANWDFYSKTLKGALKQVSKEENALQTINGTVGEALGKTICREEISAGGKRKSRKND